MSSRITSGGRARAVARPRSPSGALSTSRPSRASRSTRRAVSAGSSSITSTRARVPVAFADHAIGSSNQNVEPSPSALSKPMRPPWAEAISWQSASPRPVPPILRVSEVSTRKNLVKTWSCWSAGMPSPASVTQTRAKPPRRSAERVTTPPAGEYLIAFESRLPIICAIRSRSPTSASAPSRPASSRRWLGDCMEKRSTSCCSSSPRSNESSASVKRPASIFCRSRKSSTSAVSRRASLWIVCV